MISKLLNVTEIFYSLQGESTLSGSPCIFIRLTGCNLRCAWCDTSYAWENGTPMESDEILRRVQSYPAKLVELTGGEPLLQEQGVLELVNALHHSGYSIMLETNGSLNLSQIPKYVRKVVDVKCPGSGYGNSFMISNLECLHDQDELKFVLADEADYRFAKVFIADNQLTDLVLLFSPVTGKLAPVELAEWMLRDGKTARLQIQMHKLLDIK